jgi:uncharacterized flavoprotein (TIGR03862 family)
MTRRVAVVGAGPAGLRAAEVAAPAGASVSIFDSMPSAGRKFLVAGRGGFNLTNAEPLADFISRYSAGPWHDLLHAFGPDDLRAWAESLGVQTFVGSGRRVFPREMKAAPLLRRWISRLRSLGVTFYPRHLWSHFLPSEPRTLEFATPQGTLSATAQAVIFALGGASWPQTGSNASWTIPFQSAGILLNPLQPANCGWNVAWSENFLKIAEGKPLKNIQVSTNHSGCYGELLITNYGLEGGPLYTLTPKLRTLRSPCISIDLKPHLSKSELLSRIAQAKRFHPHEAFERWKLDPIARALLMFHPDANAWKSHSDLAGTVKCCKIALECPRPIEEAISSAGGVRWEEVDDHLMLKKLPGVFLAGEMLDWEAPTGGYLMQGCFATGTRAGLATAEWKG